MRSAQCKSHPLELAQHPLGRLEDYEEHPMKQFGPARRNQTNDLKPEEKPRKGKTRTFHTDWRVWIKEPIRDTAPNWPNSNCILRLGTSKIRRSNDTPLIWSFESLQQSRAKISNPNLTLCPNLSMKAHSFLWAGEPLSIGALDSKACSSMRNVYLFANMSA